MTAATLAPFLDLIRLAEAGDWTPSLHPRGPDGRFTHSFARLMTDAQRGHARRAAAAFKPKQGINTPDGARAYLGRLGPASPAAATYFGGGHSEVNKELRAGNDNYPGIAAMDHAMQPLPDDIIVTRRVPVRSLGDATPEQLVNFRVADAGYTAGSVATLDAGPDDVLMHIAVPKGTKAAINPDNGAIVLDRGLEMSVLHVAPNERGGKDMFLIVTPHGDGDEHTRAGLPGRGDHTAPGDAPGGEHTPGAPRPTPDSHGPTPGQPHGDAPAGGNNTAGPKSTSSVLRDAAASMQDGDQKSFAEHDPALRDEMHRAFDGTFGNLTATIDDDVSQVYFDADGHIVIRAEGYIRNKDGRIVGSFRREIHPDSGEIHNDVFALAGSEQGSGFAQQFAAHAEPILAELGLSHATVSATGVGGYAWRRYGWDPSSPAAAGDVPNRLRSILGKYDLSADDKATMERWLKAFAQPDQSKWPTPSEIGDFGKGKYTSKVDGRDMWPGKDVLVGSAWQGMRDLQTEPAAVKPAAAAA
ncbi:hypothetical protein [Dactylosporangium salmoneum]|uniref:N-acetyltransferase domain-containing protein n=1 Tax=Dactylosporangium salmoneum TaxID=53361 RepID=A0ABN3G989_9ACTN